MVGLPIVAFALLAAMVDIIVTVSHHAQHVDMVGRLMVEREAEALAQGLRMEAGTPGYELPPAMSRYRLTGSGYLARVRALDGQTLFASCPSECDSMFPEVLDARTTFWLSGPFAGPPFRLTGGKVTQHATQPLKVDLAIIGDTDGVAARVLRDVLLEDLIIPISATVTILLAVLMVIRRVLRPVKAAAERIVRLGPAAAGTIATHGMPRELQVLIDAIKDAFDGQAKAIRSQKIFTSAISHEVRTPLAVLRLELEKIADPRARRVEADLETLYRLVEQLTALARLEVMPDTCQTVDLAALAENVVCALAPLAYDKGKTLALVAKSNGSVEGYPTLIENALRNLVENAIRHAGAGAAIEVAVGPGAQLVVSDDGRTERGHGASVTLEPDSRDQPGLGLRIVRRIAELHGGQFEIGRQPAGGIRARLRLGESQVGTGRQARQSNWKRASEGNYSPVLAEDSAPKR